MQICDSQKQGRELGLVDDDRWQQFSEKREAIELERQRLKDHLGTTWFCRGRETC